MLAKVTSCAIVCLDGEVVDVEVDISNGMPMFARISIRSILPPHTFRDVSHNP